MALHRIPILGGSTAPEGSGNVFPELFPVKATNDFWKHFVWCFPEGTTRVGLYGTFNVPKNYVGTPKIYPLWTTSAVTGAVVWDLDYRAVGGDDAESLDQATAQESLTLTDTAPGAAFRLMQPSFTLTGSNLAADDLVEFIIFRDGTDAADTLAGAAAALLFSLIFEYADA